MKVNYIVSNYLGARRFSPKLNQDALFYIKEHCKFINENKIDAISKVTIVLNKSENIERDNQFISYVNDLKLNVPHELVVRENSGFSYGAWQDAVEKNRDFDYSFLTEDDYVPSSNKIIESFLKPMNKDTAYVCCLYDKGHCAISIGLLNMSIVNSEHRLNSDMVLNAEKTLSSNYVYGIHNQRLFLKNFEELGYKISDLSKTNRWFFVNHVGNIVQYGNMEGEIIIKPIDFNLI